MHIVKGVEDVILTLVPFQLSAHRAMSEEPSPGRWLCKIFLGTISMSAIHGMHQEPVVEPSCNGR